MSKTIMQIDLSPLTNRIYIGRAFPNATSWAGEKTDVTNPAIHVVAEHILREYNGVMTLTTGNVVYEIEVKKNKEVKS